MLSASHFCGFLKKRKEKKKGTIEIYRVLFGTFSDGSDRGSTASPPSAWFYPLPPPRPSDVRSSGDPKPYGINETTSWLVVKTSGGLPFQRLSVGFWTQWNVEALWYNWPLFWNETKSHWNLCYSGDLYHRQSNFPRWKMRRLAFDNGFLLRVSWVMCLD